MIFTYFLIILGICTLTSALFKVVDKLEDRT